MKCYACGYEKRSEQFTVDKVIRYKSGKRKGEIKTTEKEIIEPDEKKNDFERLVLSNDVEFTTYSNNPSYPWDQSGEKYVYICPNCGALIAK